MSLQEFILLATSSLFVIMDPIALIPAFLAMTPHDTPLQRTKMARLACVLSAVVLILFALTGQVLFKLLAITLSDFKIAGSIVLLMIALDMLRAQRSRVQSTDEEADAAAEKEDIAVTPLAIPMLAGPGAISTVILLKGQAKGTAQEIALMGCIGAVCLVCYVILRVSAHGVAWISPIAMRIVTRIMGLLLAAIAIQFVLDALAEQKGRLF